MADTPASTFSAGADDLSGTLLGSYRITGPVNRGGMGAVFRARHELLGKTAAVKVLRSELCASTEMVERFFHEARAATAIRHPGIVEVFDFGFHPDGRAFLVMELLEGESLAARLARGCPSEVAAAVIARGIASALGAAHAKGIIHRDLKPDNIFLVPDPDMPSGERPKVLDFGIAKLSEDELGRRTSRTRTGALMGTPSYMAPEQARAAAEIDQRADLYSLGCVLYEMLTGAPPFVAEGAGEVISMHLFAEPERPSARRPGVAPELDRIALRLLAKDPDARYQNAFEVGDALSAAIPTLGAAPTTAPTHRRPALVVPTLATDASPTLRRAPIRSGARTAWRLAAVALGVVAAVIAFAVVRARHRPAPGALRAPAPTSPVATSRGPTDLAGPASPPPAGPATPPTDISYHLEIAPAEADVTVEVDGAPVTLTGKGFFTAPSRADRRLVVIRAPGYADASFTLAGDADDFHRVALARDRSPGVGSAPTRASGAARGNNRGPGSVESSEGSAAAGATRGVRPGSDATSDTVTTGSGSRLYRNLGDDDE